MKEIGPTLRRQERTKSQDGEKPPPNKIGATSNSLLGIGTNKGGESNAGVDEKKREKKWGSQATPRSRMKPQEVALFANATIEVVRKKKKNRFRPQYLHPSGHKKMERLTINY